MKRRGSVVDCCCAQHQVRYRGCSTPCVGGRKRFEKAERVAAVISIPPQGARGAAAGAGRGAAGPVHLPCPRSYPRLPRKPTPIPDATARSGLSRRGGSPPRRASKSLALARISPNLIKNLPARTARKNFQEICLYCVDSVHEIKICDKSACLYHHQYWPSHPPHHSRSDL